MDIKEFKEDFLQEIKAEAVLTGEGSSATFVNAFAQYLLEADFLASFNTSYFEGKGKHGRRVRVDGYSYNELDKTMSLVIADYNAYEKELTLNKIQAKALTDKLKHFIEQSLNTLLYKEIEMSRSCFDLVDLLREKRKEVRKYQLLIFTTSSISASITRLESSAINDVPTECQIWDMERLFKVCSSDTGRQIIEINFKEYTQYGISCLEASETTSSDFKNYLCIVPGELLANIYDKYGSRLLEGNVRSFLSTKVAVNKKIRTTIINNPDRFFAYNNGISATAMDIRLETTKQGQFIIFAKDFQIINGGQTTASLSNARHKDKADIKNIFVQMKLTVINKTLEDDEAIGLIQDISRSSNSQNKVSDADFFSTHPFHIRMEGFSQKLWARAVGGSQCDTRWFYERARGQYLQKQLRMTSSEKNKFLLQNPKKQLITKTDLAKVRNTWKGLPHIVSQGAQTNFIEFAKAINNEWDSTKDAVAFNEKYFQESIALSILFKHTELMVPRQVWYSQGYRANIVTYSIAFLHHQIQKQFPNMELDLMCLWTYQIVSEPIAKALIDISELVYRKLTDSSRGVENVTQWCKREGCWTSVKNINYSLSSDIEPCLIWQVDLLKADQEAKNEQKINSGTETLTNIINISAKQWQNALTFATEKRLITSDEFVAMKTACQIPKKTPTLVQCKKLMIVLIRLEEEGFKL